MVFHKSQIHTQCLRGEKILLSGRHYHQLILHLYIFGNYDWPIKYVQSRIAVCLGKDGMVNGDLPF